MKNSALQVCLPGAVVLAAIAGQAFGDYGPGFDWDRTADWLPGIHGDTLTNNPGPDSLGNAVWTYEFVTGGGGLDSANPWYAQPASLMEWDAQWAAQDFGVWAKGDNFTPLIDQNGLLHQLAASRFDSAPVMRWQNPVGEGALIDIVGEFLVTWNSTGATKPSVDDEIVVALDDASAGEIIPLFQTVASKPTPGGGAESLVVPIDLSAVAIDAGDSILITHRGVDVDSGWIDLHDQDVMITLIPSPGSAGLLVAAGLTFVRRRR